MSAAGTIPSPLRSRTRLLRLMETHGLLLSGPDNRILVDLEQRGHAEQRRACDLRGFVGMARVWSITAAGRAWLAER